MSKTIKIKTTVPEAVLAAYNATLHEACEYDDLYGIHPDMLGDCAEDILRGMADEGGEDEIIVDAEYLIAYQLPSAPLP